VDQIAEAMGAPKPKIIHIPTDVLGQVVPKRAEIVTENFQFNNIFDNSAAKTDLNFSYTVLWKQGVRRMMTWLEANQQIADSDLDPFEDKLIAAWQALGQNLAGNFDQDD
jgi:nucleoside-diphosphate-sugar epimerase